MLYTSLPQLSWPWGRGKPPSISLLPGSGVFLSFFFNFYLRFGVFKFYFPLTMVFPSLFPTRNGAQRSLFNWYFLNYFCIFFKSTLQLAIGHLLHFTVYFFSYMFMCYFIIFLFEKNFSITVLSLCYY